MSILSAITNTFNPTAETTTETKTASFGGDTFQNVLDSVWPGDDAEAQQAVSTATATATMQADIESVFDELGVGIASSFIAALSGDSGATAVASDEEADATTEAADATTEAGDAADDATAAATDETSDETGEEATTAATTESDEEDTDSEAETTEETASIKNQDSAFANSIMSSLEQVLLSEQLKHTKS